MKSMVATLWWRRCRRGNNDGAFQSENTGSETDKMWTSLAIKWMNEVQTIYNCRDAYNVLQMFVDVRYWDLG